MVTAPPSTSWVCLHAYAFSHRFLSTIRTMSSPGTERCHHCTSITVNLKESAASGPSLMNQAAVTCSD